MLSSFLHNQETQMPDSIVPFGSSVCHTQLGWMHHSEKHISVQSHSVKYWMPAIWWHPSITQTISDLTCNERLTISIFQSREIQFEMHLVENYFFLRIRKCIIFLWEKSTLEASSLAKLDHIAYERYCKQYNV